MDENNQSEKSTGENATLLNAKSFPKWIIPAAGGLIIVLIGILVFIFYNTDEKISDDDTDTLGAGARDEKISDDDTDTLGAGARDEKISDDDTDTLGAGARVENIDKLFRNKDDRHTEFYYATFVQKEDKKGLNIIRYNPDDHTSKVVKENFPATATVFEEFRAQPRIDISDDRNQLVFANFGLTRFESSSGFNYHHFPTLGVTGGSLDDGWFDDDISPVFSPDGNKIVSFSSKANCRFSHDLSDECRRDSKIVMLDLEAKKTEVLIDSVDAISHSRENFLMFPRAWLQDGEKDYLLIEIRNTGGNATYEVNDFRLYDFDAKTLEKVSMTAAGQKVKICDTSVNKICSVNLWADEQSPTGKYLHYNRVIIGDGIRITRPLIDTKNFSKEVGLLVKSTPVCGLKEPHFAWTYDEKYLICSGYDLSNTIITKSPEEVMEYFKDADEIRFPFVYKALNVETGEISTLFIDELVAKVSSEEREQNNEYAERQLKVIDDYIAKNPDKYSDEEIEKERGIVNSIYGEHYMRQTYSEARNILGVTKDGFFILKQQNQATGDRHRDSREVTLHLTDFKGLDKVLESIEFEGEDGYFHSNGALADVFYLGEVVDTWEQ